VEWTPQAKQAFQEFKPDEGCKHQADDPPPGHVGQEFNFKIF